MDHIKTSIADLSLLSNGIIHIKVNDYAEFDINEMLEIREASKQLSGGKDYCVLLESGQMVTYTQEAMKASSTPEHSERRIALAILKNNLAITIIANFYLKAFKSSSQTMAFQSKEKALDWLKAMQKEIRA